MSCWVFKEIQDKQMTSRKNNNNANVLNGDFTIT